MMARIRTIKPEFPQSESMGRVSRESRLCFILLWTLADDAGRLRGNGRMLASLLYPYDDDAKKLIEKWLDELEQEKCIERYEVGGDRYVQIAAWMTHQKIDKPSVSKIPPNHAKLKEASRPFAKPRDGSTADQGEDQGMDQGEELALTELVNRKAAAPYRVPSCDYEEVVKVYAECLAQLPQVAVMTDTRKSHINARWRDVCAAEKLDTAAALDYFRKFFVYAGKSAFLTGSGPPRRDVERVWRADLDWLMNPQNFAKVIEGRYHQKAKAA
jgi:hypothetical protein